jgi:hypothetical protein
MLTAHSRHQGSNSPAALGCTRSPRLGITTWTSAASMAASSRSTGSPHRCGANQNVHQWIDTRRRDPDSVTPRWGPERFTRIHVDVRSRRVVGADGHQGQAERPVSASRAWAYPLISAKTLRLLLAHPDQRQPAATTSRTCNRRINADHRYNFGQSGRKSRRPALPAVAGRRRGEGQQPPQIHRQRVPRHPCPGRCRTHRSRTIHRDAHSVNRRSLKPPDAQPD